MVSWGVETGEIYSAETTEDDEGKQWHVINQDTWYPADGFTMAEAKAEYQSEEAKMRRYNSTYSTWCD